MSMLEQLVESSWLDLERRRKQVPLEKLDLALESRPKDRPFNEALAAPGLSLIAEFKRKSPSSGSIREDATVSDTVKAFESGGAAALSILTEREHFGGSLEDINEARDATGLPILRKDFIVDPYMLYEAAASGADAVLLIVAALDRERLEALYEEAGGLDLDCLIEVHDEKELEVALALDADVIGINNRDLSDFSVDIERTLELISDVPAGKTVVSESGITGRGHLDELERVGVDAVLIGEALMRSEDPGQLCRDLIRAEEGTQA